MHNFSYDGRVTPHVFLEAETPISNIEERNNYEKPSCHLSWSRKWGLYRAIRPPSQPIRELGMTIAIVATAMPEHVPRAAATAENLSVKVAASAVAMTRGQTNPVLHAKKASDFGTLPAMQLRYLGPLLCLPSSMHQQAEERHKGFCLPSDWWSFPELWEIYTFGPQKKHAVSNKTLH